MYAVHDKLTADIEMLVKSNVLKCSGSGVCKKTVYIAKLTTFIGSISSDVSIEVANYHHIYIYKKSVIMCGRIG